MGFRVKVLCNASGMALLITLAAISFLVAVTVQLATSVNWQMQVSANQTEAVRLNAQLHSGLSLLRAALYSDAQGDKVDTLQDEWEALEFENVQSLLGAEQLVFEVDDLSGLIQVNRLWLSAAELKKMQQQQRGQQQGQRQSNQLSPQQYEQLQRGLWRRFLLSGHFVVEEQDEADELFDALADWLDEDDDERDNGAEDGHYKSLAGPYACRNGPLQYLEELRLVKGFTKEIVYGDGERYGIIDYLTIDGQDGKININTAPPQVLQALAEGLTMEMAEQLDAFRNDSDNLDALKNTGWYRQVDDIPGDVSDNLDANRNLLTVESFLFLCTITVTGGNGLQLTGTGKIERDNATHAQNLLSWKVE